jgi:uncharacterized membrane protein
MILTALSLFTISITRAQTVKPDTNGVKIETEEFKKIIKIFVEQERLNKENIALYEEVLLLHKVIGDKDEALEISKNNYAELAKECGKTGGFWDRIRDWVYFLGGLTIGILAGTIN